MKYKKEYKSTVDKKTFVDLVLKNYPDIKKSTAERRYYDVRKTFKNQPKKYLPQEKLKPNHFKMLEFKDMKRLNIKITKEYLFKYGFFSLEINWLEDEGLLN